MEGYRLNSVLELAGGARLGGNFIARDAPIRQTLALWKGRPPLLDEAIQGPLTLAISATPPAADPGRTVTIHAEGANAWGGRVTRIFSVGGGLSAELRLGNFQHVRAVAMQAADGDTLPQGMGLYFTWSLDLLGRTPLWHYLAVAAGTPTVLPEGTESVTPELACTLTYLLPTFGTTVVKTVSAGEEVPAQWGAFSCNIANQFLLKIRGL
jgi:hypothetical protein